MPMYDVECDVCGKTTETMIKLKDIDKVKVGIPCSCTADCKGRMYRIINKTGTFILKGRGWYKDGY